MSDPALVANCIGFGRLLRRAGLDATPDGTRAFTEALSHLGFDSKAQVRAAGRAIFIRRREDRELFDRAFALFWRRHIESGPEDGQPLPRIRQDHRQPQTFPAPLPAAEVSADDVPTRPERSLTSGEERLKYADFALLTA